MPIVKVNRVRIKTFMLIADLHNPHKSFDMGFGDIRNEHKSFDMGFDDIRNEDKSFDTLPINFCNGQKSYGIRFLNNKIFPFPFKLVGFNLFME